MIRALVFDLDDTLFEELSYVRSGFRHVAEWLVRSEGGAATDYLRALEEDFELRGRGRNFDALVERFGIRTAVERLVRMYREHPPVIRVRPDLVEFLGELRQEYQLFLLTDGWLEVQQKKVAALELEPMFDRIYYSQSNGLTYAKPHPRFFCRLLEDNGLHPSQALMIGNDVAKDIEGGRGVGMHTFRVHRLLDATEQEQLRSVLTKLGGAGL
jgi:putative hydrolase of the HAD superfamily